MSQIHVSNSCVSVRIMLNSLFLQEDEEGSDKQHKREHPLPSIEQAQQTEVGTSSYTIGWSIDCVNNQSIYLALDVTDVRERGRSNADGRYPHILACPETYDGWFSFV